MSANRIGNSTTKPTLTPSQGQVEQDKIDKAADTKSLSAVENTTTPNPIQSPKSPKGNFDVNISHGAKDKATAFHKAFEIAKQTPDIREDRVQALKEQIQNGTYKVDPGLIADGMLTEAIKERLAETTPR